MARTFYTERDIEDLAKRGVTEIMVDDSVSITDAARERMDRLGVKRKVMNGNTAASNVLKSPDAASLHKPAPTAPNTPAAKPAQTAALTDAERQEVIDKVNSGVIARLGAGVDSKVVDQIVRKVVGQL